MARKKSAKIYTIMVVPENESTTRSFTIRTLWLKIIGAAILFIISVAIIVGITYGKLVKTAIDFSNLQEDYQLLISEREKIHEILRDLRTLQFYKKQVTNTLTGYVDLKKIARDTIAIDSPIEEYSFRAREEAEELAITFKDYPVLSPLDGFITRKLELSGGEYNHPGIDIAATKGAPVKAAGGGVVIFSGWNREFGNTIIILHDGGFHTHYSHCQNMLVKAGDAVTPGMVIGTAGNTGIRSSGVHLHFELWKNDLPLDPLKFIKKLND